MAVYKRSIAAEDDNTEPTIQKCITIRFQIPSMDCYATVTLCDNEYTMDENGVVTINSPKTVYCTGFPTIPIVVLAQTTFPSFKRDKYTTQGGIVNPYTTNGRVDAIVGLSITTSGGSPMTTNATLQGGTVTVTSGQELMPKLAEWHIYGNEQQGRFVTRKPDFEPCYYLGGVTNDVANLNFFRILDKKEYELKDHLGNVRVAIGDMKLPENEATSTRGVPPFVTDEKAVNDYYPFGMTIADRSWQSTDYRYGYNTQEKSTEIDPFGNHNTAEFWEYDARSGRRWNLDPVVKPWQSGYSTFAGDPINYCDPDGDEERTCNPEDINPNTGEPYEDNSIAPDPERLKKYNSNLSQSSSMTSTIHERTPVLDPQYVNLVSNTTASNILIQNDNMTKTLFYNTSSELTYGIQAGIQFKYEGIPVGIGVNAGSKSFYNGNTTKGFEIQFGIGFSYTVIKTPNKFIYRKLFGSLELKAVPLGEEYFELEYEKVSALSASLTNIKIVHYIQLYFKKELIIQEYTLPAFTIGISSSDILNEYFKFGGYFIINGSIEHDAGKTINDFIK